MAADQPPQEIVAIAFLVESSLEVAQEWRKKITDYSAALVKRLADCHPSSKLKVAFVSYGPADTAPSPILCKRFFIDHPSFFKEMTEDLSRLGIGMTNSGGIRGMAALEGFAAVLELFDILQSCLPQRDGSSNPPPAFHIVHIAASSPDSSLHPLLNDSTTLDNVDWDTLPLEIKKRNIQFTSINLQPGLKHFSELFAAVVSGGSSSPWFNVHNTHTILLAAFPTPPQSKGMPIKRPNEPPAERAPENKRPRLQPSTESPKPAPKAVTPQTQPNLPMPVHVQPPPRPVMQATSSQPIANPINSLAKGPSQLSQQQITEKMRIAEAYIQAMQQKIAAAQAEGNMPLVETLLKEYHNKKEAHAKISQVFQQYFGGHLQNKAQTNILQNQGYSHSLSTSNLPSTSSSISLPQDVATNPSQMQHVRSLSDANFPMNVTNNLSTTNMTPAGNPNITLQMQKMIEQQQQRIRPPHPAVGQTLSGNLLHNIAPSTGLPNRLNPTAGPSQLSQQPDQSSTKGKPVWRGSLNWSGTSPTGKKDMRAFVIAVHTNDTKCHQDTWPTEMTLAPTRETSAPSADIGNWLQRHHSQAAICSFQPPSNIPDARGNEASLSSLVNLLLDKKLEQFATAAWTTPKGEQTKNALIFPAGGKLFGAFFALTGLPDLPTPMPVIPAHILAQLQSIPQDAQKAFFNKFAHPRPVIAPQQQQASRSQDPNNTPAFTPNLHLAHNMMNMMNGQAPNGAMMNVNGPQPSFTSSLPRVGMNNNPVPNNVSLAMLHSFIQRNDGGTNLNPQG